MKKQKTFQATWVHQITKTKITGITSDDSEHGSNCSLILEDTAHSCFLRHIIFDNYVFKFNQQVSHIPIAPNNLLLTP